MAPSGRLSWNVYAKLWVDRSAWLCDRQISLGKDTELFPGLGRGWRSKVEDNLEMAVEFLTLLRRVQERGCMTTTTEMIGGPGEGAT